MAKHVIERLRQHKGAGCSAATRSLCWTRSRNQLRISLVNRQARSLRQFNRHAQPGPRFVVLVSSLLAHVASCVAADDPACGRASGDGHAGAVAGGDGRRAGVPGRRPTAAQPDPAAAVWGHRRLVPGARGRLRRPPDARYAGGRRSRTTINSILEPAYWRAGWYRQTHKLLLWLQNELSCGRWGACASTRTHRPHRALRRDAHGLCLFWQCRTMPAPPRRRSTEVAWPFPCRSSRPGTGASPCGAGSSCRSCRC